MDEPFPMVHCQSTDTYCFPMFCFSPYLGRSLLCYTSRFVGMVCVCVFFLKTCPSFARSISLQIFMKHRETCAPLFASILSSGLVRENPIRVSLIVTSNAKVIGCLIPLLHYVYRIVKTIHFLFFCHNKPMSEKIKCAFCIV